MYNIQRYIEYSVLLRRTEIIWAYKDWNKNLINFTCAKLQVMRKLNAVILISKICIEYNEARGV